MGGLFEFLEVPLSAQEFLVRGIAALKAGLPASAGEARHYLHKVLADSDAKPHLKSQAWLYLGRIEEGVDKRRACFESVLAIDPGNAQARQGLAVLDGRLKVEDMVDPNSRPKPFIPDASPDSSVSTRLVCPKCSAKLLPAPDCSEPRCSYCGAKLEDDPVANRGDRIEEQDFFAALPTEKARRWEYPTERMLRCEGCGATYVLAPLQMGGPCPFCGTTHVVHEAPREFLQPGALIPFQFDRAQAAVCLGKWAELQRFCPKDLVACMSAVELRGVFLPFWTFDISGTMDWRALVAERRGKRTEWVPQTGLHLVYQDDLLVPASRRFAEESMECFAGFDPDALVPYSEQYLAGATTEVYQVTLAEASVLARQMALEKAKLYERKTSLDGKRCKEFTMNSTGMVIDSFKLVLLPLWLGSYAHGGQKYPIAVNGQIGTVAGKVPRDWLQRTLATLFSAF